MSDIFISYSKEDRERAEALAAALGEHGWSVFWDRTIPPGLTWREFIGNELEEARCVLVGWSEVSVESEWVLEEAESGKERKGLIPVLFETVKPPFGFGGRQAVDLSDWEGDANTSPFPVLVEGLERLLGPSPASDLEQRQRAQLEAKEAEAEAAQKAENARRVEEDEAKRQGGRGAEEERRRGSEKGPRARTQSEAAQQGAAILSSDRVEPPVLGDLAQEFQALTEPKNRKTLIHGLEDALKDRPLTPAQEAACARSDFLLDLVALALHQEAGRSVDPQRTHTQIERELDRVTASGFKRSRIALHYLLRSVAKSAHGGEIAASDLCQYRDLLDQITSRLVDRGLDPSGHLASSIQTMLREMKKAELRLPAGTPEIAIGSGAPTWEEDERLNPRILIEGGTFQMGSGDDDPDADDEEKPQHPVTVSSFWIQEHPVTNVEYKRFKPSHSFEAGRERHPVVRVVWQEAMDYAQWVGGSLPTEAQWEYAARGTECRKYPWGSDEPTPEHANYSGTGVGDTTSVATYPKGATPEGVHNLAGNVHEWCSDWIHPYTGDEQVDPAVEDMGDSAHRVLRGAAFGRGPRLVRCASRDAFAPGDLANDVGFRVVVPAHF